MLIKDGVIDRLVPQQAAAQFFGNRRVFGQLYNVGMNYWIGSKSPKPFRVPGYELLDVLRYPQPAINTCYSAPRWRSTSI